MAEDNSWQEDQRPSKDQVERKGKKEKVWKIKDSSPTYTIPSDIQDLIQSDVVPKVLKSPLSPNTYYSYFKTLLYAEDNHLEKWRDFLLRNIKLRPEKVKIRLSKKEEEKTMVAFDLDTLPENKPFLLSRDYVFAKVTGKHRRPFQGFVYRVVKSSKVLVEFSDDFLNQHDSEQHYDISFSFNRVCLKRSHQAIDATCNPLFQLRFVFPDKIPLECVSSDTQNPASEFNPTVHQILSFQGSSTFLLEGKRSNDLVVQVVPKIYRYYPENKVLVCGPSNKPLDKLLRVLKMDIPEGDIFRFNAAFREIQDVDADILPSCVYEEECFGCPSLHQLKKIRIILATFISSFRLRNAGIDAGHYSHIFLLDASCATEPETMVALAKLITDRTRVIITGRKSEKPKFVRSYIARNCGLRVSYFERLYGRATQ